MGLGNGITGGLERCEAAWRREDPSPSNSGKHFAQKQETADPSLRPAPVKLRRERQERGAALGMTIGAVSSEFSAD
jgi:hypothetical protein